MNLLIREFFRTVGSQEPHFLDVRFLNEEPETTWNEADAMGVPRGWYELSCLKEEDRVEFIKEFWLKQLSFHPTATKAIAAFFDRLDDIAVVACRQTNEEPWRPELIYSLGDNSCFFRGLIPADEEELNWTKSSLSPNLPRDFWAFFRLHNGFGKLAELGLLPLDELIDIREKFLESALVADQPLRFGNRIIDPYSIFPFYEEYGAGFQAFNAEWYPGSEMGNVYFSGIDNTLSDISDRKAWAENLAFPTFVEWLAAFLEGLNSSL